MATKIDEPRGTASARDTARTVFDHAQIGMAVLDYTGALIQTNPALRRLLGLEPDAPADQSLASLIDTAHRDMWLTTVDALVADGTPVRIDLKLRASNDTERWVRVHLSRAPDDDTGSSPIVGTFEEVTDEKKAVAEPQAMTRRMQQLVDQAGALVLNCRCEEPRDAIG